MRPERHADAAFRAQLRHVYWIGGGSGAGKSTIARRMAARHGLRLFATDDVMSDHAGRSAPGDVPFHTTEWRSDELERARPGGNGMLAGVGRKPQGQL
jgi:hypothetical protein